MKPQLLSATSLPNRNCEPRLQYTRMLTRLLKTVQSLPTLQPFKEPTLPPLPRIMKSTSETARYQRRICLKLRAKKEEMRINTSWLKLLLLPIREQLGELRLSTSCLLKTLATKSYPIFIKSITEADIRDDGLERD